MDRQVRPARAGESHITAECRALLNALGLQAYALYLRLFYSAKVAQQKKLKTEILANKKELLQTSAQDQFAKWAKLRRSVDKGLADLEKLSESHASLLAFHPHLPNIVLDRVHVHVPVSND